MNDTKKSFSDVEQENEKWPAVEFFQGGGLGLEQIYSLEDLYRGKRFCDIGHGTGNILHAVYPLVESLVGFETPHAPRRTAEINFLRDDQSDTAVELIYQPFIRESWVDEEFLKKIDFFYCAVGVEHAGEMGLEKIFLANPNAVLVHYFRMSDVSFGLWKKVRIGKGQRTFSLFKHGDPVLDAKLNDMSRHCIGESAAAVGTEHAPAPLRAAFTVAQDVLYRGEKQEGSAYVCIYGKEDIVTPEIVDKVTRTCLVGDHGS